MATFRTILLATGGNNVGIEVPAEVVESFGAGKRVPVQVTLNGYSYASTVAVMGGRYLIPLSSAHRRASGAAAGDELDVTLEHDATPRTVEVPADLRTALEEAGVWERFESLAYSHRKEHVRAVEEAKKPETRVRRIEATVAKLSQSAAQR